MKGKRGKKKFVHGLCIATFLMGLALPTKNFAQEETDVAQISQKEEMVYSQAAVEKEEPFDSDKSEMENTEGTEQESFEEKKESLRKEEKEIKEVLEKKTETKEDPAAEISSTEFFSESSSLRMRREVSSGEIYDVSSDVSEAEPLPVEGKEIHFTLMTSSMPKEQIRMKVLVNDIEQALAYVTTGEKAKKIVTVTIPENTKTTEMIYQFFFNADGSDNFDLSPHVTLTQQAMEKINVVLDEVFIKYPYMPKEGGDTTISVKGENLTKGKLSLGFYTLINGTKTKVQTIDATPFYGTDKIQTANITFSPVDVDTKYEVEVVSDVTDTRLHGDVTLAKGETKKDIGDFQPRHIYFTNKNTLILVFDKPLREARENAIVNGIQLISKDGVKKVLSEEDTYELDENSLILSFAEEIIQDFKGGNIEFADRVIQYTDDVSEKENKKFSHIINSIGLITESYFTKGELLDYRGGDVEVILKGVDFNRDLVKVKVAKREALKKFADGHIGTDEITPINVTIKDDTITVQYVAPTNLSERPESYIVMVSLDGANFDSSFAQTNNERARRLVHTVVPKNNDLEKPSLGFMSITSYGTNGGDAEVPDITHTYTPVNQESKKTFLHLYGANLRENLTKLRAVDENGVIFYPTKSSTYDSSDRFMMVSWAIRGNGNKQFIEMIAPRMYKKDQTYTYQVAVDGIHFDTEVTVKATVVDDEEGSLEKGKLLRTIIVKYVDENGKEIHPERKLKVYKNLSPEVMNMQAIEIEGYEIQNPLNEVSNDQPFTKLIPEIEEKMEVQYIFRYKNKNPQIPEEPTIPENPEKPNKPELPENPTDPEMPNTPKNPALPKVNENPTETEKESPKESSLHRTTAKKSPQTSDGGILSYAMSALAALSGFGLLKRKKK